ncbi:MAG: glycosyltransferase [Chloroflexi bacterium]|nr:glycosyltransferase [Chloroflexota bacterium]
MTILAGAPALSSSAVQSRPDVRGKFICVGGEALFVRGVTYGTFRPGADGSEYPDPAIVEHDFAEMAAANVNAVRTYTVPPRWLLDAAERHGLRVMVGLPWEQHVAFLDDRRIARRIEERVRAGARACAGHPALLCYAIGNEIPAPIVRWHGHRRIERFVERLYRAAKAEDPEGLVTYVNYPSTEYLDLPFVDFSCFNVYLESQARLEAYLARLHNVAGDRPLVLAEIGLDSRRHGEDAQARALDWQVRTAFAAGCAGAFVFAWTDEWHRGGYDVDDWDFGLTRRDRQPKPARSAVAQAFAEAPWPPEMPWPRISVIVCTYNGARTIRDCLEGLRRLEYPNSEVIVVDDGSTDGTAAIVREYGFRLVGFPTNRGLSSARNAGLAAATGEIVAYTDDDARPDPHWLTYLATTFLRTGHAGVGGPNLAPSGDGAIADCIANAPGGPIHVLLSDQEAEHIPGCNMAFRKTALDAIGGFDPQFCTAGDDVDVCWRLQQRGWTLGFSPAAFVWHHRRNSVRAYWKQQQGYGRAEALLERKWPEKYNAAGHLTWAGRLYGKGLTQMLGWHRGRIYQGTWGCAPFQSLYQPAPGLLRSLPQMPEWYLVVVVPAALAALGALWTPLLLAAPLAVLAAGASIVQACLSAARASFPDAPSSRLARLNRRSLTAFLHLIQPLARLIGRLRHGLTPWRRRGTPGLALPWPWRAAIWCERWRALDERLRILETATRAAGAVVLRGGDYDGWDLEIRGGMLGGARLLTAVEEHGAGKQLVRLHTWPRCSANGLIPVLLLAALATGAALDQAVAPAAMLGLVALLLALRLAWECAAAMDTVHRALNQTGMGRTR